LPEGNDGKPLSKRLWVKVDDKKLFNEFIKLENEEGDNSLKLFTLLSTIGLYEFSGIIDGEKKINVLKTSISERSSGPKLKYKKSESVETGVVLLWNAPPSFPKNELSILATLLKLVTFFYIRGKKVKLENKDLA